MHRPIRKKAMDVGISNVEIALHIFAGSASKHLLSRGIVTRLTIFPMMMMRLRSFLMMMFFPDFDSDSDDDELRHHTTHDGDNSDHHVPCFAHIAIPPQPHMNQPSSFS